MSMNMVGVPMTEVHLSSAIARTVASPTKLLTIGHRSMPNVIKVPSDEMQIVYSEVKINT